MVDGLEAERQPNPEIVYEDEQVVVLIETGEGSPAPVAETIAVPDLDDGLTEDWAAEGEPPAIDILDVPVDYDAAAELEPAE